MIYQLKVTLKGIRPPVWRRVQVSGDLTLGQLHRVLQIVMGWTDSHLHQFIVDGERYATPSPDDWGEPPSDERKVRVHDLARAKTRLRYEYDFGDGWEHDVLVEKIVPAHPERAAVCVAGRRACPPEDCGGPWGYAELLEILADPKHEEHAERREWLGRKFDPEEFDMAATNSILSKYGPRRRGASG
jgi:hypothetical protein